MKTSLARWFRSPTTPARGATGRARLGVEALEGRWVPNADFDLSAEVTPADEVVGQANHLADLIPPPGGDPVAELSAAISALNNELAPNGFDLSAEATAVSPWDLVGTFEADPNSFGVNEVAPVGEIDGSDYAVADWSDTLGSLQLVEDGVSPLADLDWASLNPQPLPPREYEVVDAGADFDVYALNPQPLPPMEWAANDAVVPYEAVATLDADTVYQAPVIILALDAYVSLSEVVGVTALAGTLNAELNCLANNWVC